MLQTHQYVYDVETAVNSASAWFSEQYPSGGQTKDLVVFDIDETVLSNFNVSAWPFSHASPFGSADARVLIAHRSFGLSLLFQFSILA